MNCRRLAIAAIMGLVGFAAWAAEPVTNAGTDDLSQFLKSIDKQKPKPNNLFAPLMNAADKAKPLQVTPCEPSSIKDADLSNRNEALSRAEIDRLRAHVEKCWVPPVGAKDRDTPLVTVQVFIGADGSVCDARIVGRPMQADGYWQAVADSARRAVRLCSPLPIPKDKYDALNSRGLLMTFDANKALGKR